MMTKLPIAAGLLVAASAATGAIADVPRTQPDQSLQQLARELEPFRNVAYAQSRGYRQGSPGPIPPPSCFTFRTATAD
jgi:hypothetical protein